MRSRRGKLWKRKINKGRNNHGGFRHERKEK